MGRIGLLKAIRNYNEKYALSTLAWICIYREVLQHILKEQKFKKRHQLLDGDVAIQPHDKIYELIPESLSKQEWTIIEMRLAGYTFKEIGESLSRTKDQVRKHYHKIVEKIRKAND